MNRRPAAPRPTLRFWQIAGAAGIAAIAFLLLWIAYSAAHSQLRQQLQYEIFYWDAYLAAQYQANPDWQAIAGKLEQAAPLPISRQSGASFTLWDAGKQLVYQHGNLSQQLQQLPIIYEGRIAGYMAIGPASIWKANESALARTATAIAILALSGCAAWLAALRAASRQLAGQLSGRLRRLAQLADKRGAGPAAGSLLAKGSSMEGGSMAASGSAAAGGCVADRGDMAEVSLTPPMPPGFDYEQLPARFDLQLDRLQAKLAQLEQVRKTMVADIAHELRTPLAVLRAQLDNAIARQAPLLPEQLVLLHDEAYRMSKLISDLNQLALAEAGHLPLDKAWFDVQPLLASLTEAFAAEAEEGGIALDLHIELRPTRGEAGPGTPLAPIRATIYADRSRIQQVLVNLLGNAIRYARSRITLTFTCDGITAAFAVEDDGIGIDSDQLDHLFERFYRAASKAERREGSGLGLAIAQQYALAHGGRIAVSSEWNAGSVFTVTLPVFRE